MVGKSEHIGHKIGVLQCLTSNREIKRTITTPKKTLTKQFV